MKTTQSESFFHVPWASLYLHSSLLIPQMWLSPILSVLACCLRMEISFSIVLKRKTLRKNEVKEDGRVAVSALVRGTPH